MRTVFVNGCFDLFHAGHKAFLKFAASQGDYLIAAVNSDASVRRLKGEGRPIDTLEQRMMNVEEWMLLFTRCATIPFEGDADRLIMEIRPDVVVIGEDHDKGAKFMAMRGYGWKSGAPIRRIPIVVAPRTMNISTTLLLKQRSEQ